MNTSINSENAASEPMDSTTDTVLQEPEPRFRRVIRVGPWRNKEEFAMVYEWLFGENANDQTKQDACKRILIWKMRRQELTPAPVLCTLILIEMQLKDSKSQMCEYLTNDDLRIMYSSTCTRFLNYMSSILQTKYLKTMYQTAKQLGLASFLVDLRHLCAHGIALPDIDLFRRTTKYCVNWLKEYYWDHEMKYMKNVDAKDIRRFGRTSFDEEINQLFINYDVISEALIKNCQRIKRAKRCLSAVNYIILKRFSNSQNNCDLKQLLRICIKQLSTMVKQHHIVRGGSRVYIEALMNMNFFFESAAYRTTNDDEIALMIDVHQPLFQAMAISGYIEKLFRRLMYTAENVYESVVKRKGASFWAHQIVKGFIAFRKFKFQCKEILTKKHNKKIPISTINTLTVSKKILNIYKSLKVDISTTLIIGDSIRNPWSLYFKREYIENRIKGADELTKDVIKDCLQLVVPYLKHDEEDSLKQLIDIHIQSNLVNSDDDNNEDETRDEIPKKKLKRILDNSEIYTLSHLTGEDELNPSKTNDGEDGEEKQIWKSAPEGIDWGKCPIGRLPWEDS